MEYRVENYRSCERFNGQYPEIYRFLLEAEGLGYNEHFHWGRFAWMQAHSMLEEDKLTSIVLFREESGKLVGMLTYDTFYDDRVYLLHTSSDEELLRRMVDRVLQTEGETIKVNSKDLALMGVLKESGFVRTRKDGSVLELALTGTLEYGLPEGYAISPENFEMDNWQYQLVIHKGFDNPGIPEKWEEAAFNRGPHKDIKTFVLAEDGYCAHCGVWYTEGETAYVEPVVTVPEHRKKGLARAVVYEACKRAGKSGAKRATVLSEQEFYYRIGFRCSSEVYCWEKGR